MSGFVHQRLFQGSDRAGAAEGQRKRLDPSANFCVGTRRQFRFNGGPAFRHRGFALTLQREGEAVQNVEPMSIIASAAQSFGNSRESFRRIQRGSAMVLTQGCNQRLVSGRSTQKLCVRFDSIVAVIDDRNHRGNHLMLSARERQVR